MIGSADVLLNLLMVIIWLHFSRSAPTSSLCTLPRVSFVEREDFKHSGSSIRTIGPRAFRASTRGARATRWRRQQSAGVGWRGRARAREAPATCSSSKTVSRVGMRVEVCTVCSYTWQGRVQFVISEVHFSPARVHSALLERHPDFHLRLDYGAAGRSCVYKSPLFVLLPNEYREQPVCATSAVPCPFAWPLLGAPRHLERGRTLQARLSARSTGAPSPNTSHRMGMASPAGHRP